jgi:putative addiction module component (TIGR02574 family)
MGRTFEQLYREALQLPESDRAELAGLLIRSLDPEPEPDVEAAWDEVIERRVREIDEGTVQTIPWEQVRAEMNARIGKKP